MILEAQKHCFKKAAEKNYIGVALLSDKEGVYGLGIALTKRRNFIIFRLRDCLPVIIFVQH